MTVTDARPAKGPSLLAGAAGFALAVLTLLYFFDQFDTAAFNVLAPNIERAFHLSDRDFGLIVIANLTLVLCFAVAVGHYGDRLPRTRIVVAGGIVAGIFSFFTGIVGSLALLVLVRLGNGVGQVVNDPVHNSLLSDYYPPGKRPQIFAAHQNAVFLGAIVGPAVAGTAAAISGWRLSFLILIVPIMAVAFLALRLREPVRGGTDDPESASELEGEEPVSFREAWRTLLAVPTLRRQYIAYLFIGAGVIPLAFLLPLYLQRVYHVGAFERGLIGAANAAFQFAGVLASARWTRRWAARDAGLPLRWAGAALGGVGLGLLLVSIAPDLGFALVAGFAASFCGGIFYPPFYSVQAAVSPARVRTLSFGIGSFFLVAGVWALWVLFEGNLSTKDGMRTALGALLPYWLVGGLVLASAGRYVRADAAKALKQLGKAIELRRARLAGESRPLLTCVGVDVAYDKVKVLFDVDFAVEEGEIVALLGTNGAGKSTLLKAISGLVDPAGGAIWFDGRDVTHLDPMSAAKIGIVQMPGGRSVFPTLTVGECLRLAGWLYRRHDEAHVKAATARALEYFPVLVERTNTLAGNLSGGEQQMLGLAMAFIAKPRLLMIDELSLGLAPTVVGRLVEIVRAIHETGTTIIIVEQSVNVALTLARRAVFMEKGEVRFSGPTTDLLERGDILRSVFLEGAAAATGHPELAAHAGAPTAPPGALGAPNGSAGRPGVVAVAPRRDRPAPDAAVVLELDEVVVDYGGIRAVNGVSFALRQGEVLGLIGPNGAGKTTIFDAISGFANVASGRISLQGVDVTAWPANRRAAAGLGRSFQDARLFPSLTVAENIAVALERHLDVREPVAAALGLPAVFDTEVEVAWRVHDLIELLGLGAFRNKFVAELSTGSRRIVDLAMSLAHGPSVLLLDEPSSGIAQRETEALGPLLLRIQQEVGCSLLVIEHDMPLITGVSDTMVALELGAVIALGEPQAVVNDPAVVASYLGTDESMVNRSGAPAPGADAVGLLGSLGTPAEGADDTTAEMPTLEPAGPRPPARRPGAGTRAAGPGRSRPRGDGDKPR
jgi:ABC-type branched-subunit amino acid transport system ATPase component/predicted MFS family arabinose efflux permease